MLGKNRSAKKITVVHMLAVCVLLIGSAGVMRFSITVLQKKEL